MNPGNVSNVNIIGTDKKYIAESDVTYINNIRYKDGIAISKSNVINGGLDVSVIRQSASSNANVINASEDVKNLLEDANENLLQLAKIYGHESKSCSICGRTLDNPLSVQMGIGPICAKLFS